MDNKVSMKKKTYYKKLLREALEENNKEVATFLIESFKKSGGDISELQQPKKKRTPKYRAKKRNLCMSINHTSGLPITLHASLASLYDRYTKPADEFIKWYEEVKQNDPEMLKIYNDYKEKSKQWIKTLEGRRL